MKRLSIITTLFLAMKVFGFAPQEGSPFLPAVKVGDVAPDAPIQERKDHAVNDTLLLARTPGKFALIEFSQTTCTGCRASLQEFLKLSDKVKSVAVSKMIYADRSADVVDTFVDANPDLKNIQVLHDGSRGVFKAYGIKGTPTTIVIGPDNKVRSVHLGDLDESTREEILKSLGL